MDAREGGGVKARLYVAGVLAGLAAVLVLAIVVLEFGISHPSPPSLRDHPRDEIPGSILYVDNRGCVVDAAASGRHADRVTCSLAGGGFANLVTWVDEQTFAYSFIKPGLTQPAWQWVRVDLATKRETMVPGSTSQPSVGADPLSGRGEQISVDPDGYLYRASSSGDRVRIYKLPAGDGASGGQFAFVTWSPDSNWFLLRYYPKGELWIISRDGLIAGTLASNVRGGGSWIIPGAGILPTLDYIQQ